MADVGFRTSGSSGAAKSIVRTEASLQADAAALVAEFPEIWGGRPAVVTSVPADHMYGALWRTRAPARAGCAVDPETVLSAEGLVAACARHGKYLFVTTPSFLEKLLAHPDAAALKGAFVGIVTSGSLLRKDAALAASAAFGVCPTEIFGSTETGTVAYRRRTEGDEWTLVTSVGATADAEGRITVDSPYAMARPFTMSDAVEFTAPRRFLLKGRTDRRVKILEDFVDLSEVEAALETHPVVARACAETYGEGVPRLGALVVLADAARARLLAEGRETLVAELRRGLLQKLGPAGFPRRIRFVRALPVNARGKTAAADVRGELLAWCREPVVTAWSPTADELSAKLVFTSDLECFNGHFPGFPILPGVAQLYFLRHFARQVFPDFPDAATYRRLKFQKVILPDSEIRLAVTRQGSGAFAFTLDGPGGRASSGLVHSCPQSSQNCTWGRLGGAAALTR